MPDTPTIPRLSLGPLLYYWPRDELLGFYEAIAESDVEVVYLGETVCPKRRTLSGSEWLDLARRLTDAGKEVVLSTLDLLEAESDLKTLRRICTNGEFMVEANDLAAVAMLADKVPFVAGPTLNVYNPRTLGLLARRGLRRWVMPVELSRDTYLAMRAARPEAVEMELFAYGRLPLALSARCFTARAQNLPKDDCRLACIDYPDGMLLKTQEDAPFLTLNGIQTQSAQTFSLLPELNDLCAVGVELLRISPQSRGTLAAIQAFRAGLHLHDHLDELERELEPAMAAGACNGYWHGTAGIEMKRP